MSEYIEYVHDPEATGSKNTATAFVVSPETAEIIEYERQRVKMWLWDWFVTLTVEDEDFQVDTSLLYRVQ